MSLDSGRNSGITGLVDIQGNPTIACRVYEFVDTSSIASVENTGEGDDGETSSRAENESGRIVLKGKVLRSLFPVPVVLANAEGTLTITYDQAGKCQKTQTVRVTSAEFKFSQKDENNWDFACVCERVGGVTWTGWPGTQTTPATPDPGTKYLYDGRSKVADAHGLVDSSTQTIDFWGIGSDDDAGEVAEIATVITGFTDPPQTNEKLYTASLTRTGSSGGRITLAWRPRDSIDEVENPGTSTIIDAGNLDSAAVRTKVDATPSTPSGFVARRTTTQILNPNHTAIRVESGLRTTVEDVEFPGTFTNIDPISVNPTGQKTTVHDTASPPSDPTPPSGTKIVRKRTTAQTSQGTPRSITVWDFAPSDYADEITQAGTVSTRSAVAPDTDSVSILLNSTSDAQTIADALAPGFVSQPFAEGMSVRKENPNYAEVVYHYLSPGVLLQSTVSGGGGRWVKAQVSGGNAQLYVNDNISRGTGKRILTFSEVWFQSSLLRNLRITKSVTGTSVPDFPSQIGTTNVASFLGLPAGTVRYLGAVCDTNLDVTGTRTFQMQYYFEYDSLGFIDGIPDELFSNPQTLTTSTTSTGWVNLSSLGLATSPSILLTSDFSVFT